MNPLRKFSSARCYMLILILLLVIWMLWPDNNKMLRPPGLTPAVLQSCHELRPNLGPYQEASVEKPGLYCVVSDFWQQRLYGAGHSGPGSWHHLISLGASNVTIDLQNHTLHSDGHSGGIGVSLDDQYWVKTRTITIKNGVIDLRGIGTAIESHHKWQMYSIDEPVPDKLTAYEEPSLVLENLLIKTDNIGIKLTGDGNIIRNCMIESGGNAAIVMAGPNGQILNNTIVLTNPFIPGSMGGVDFSQPRHFVELTENRNVPKAAIVLHQANGTIVSENRIEVKGKSVTRHNIYATNGTKDVHIEGNTFVGANDPVTLVDGSTAQLKNNVFEKKEASWWKF